MSNQEFQASGGTRFKIAGNDVAIANSDDPTVFRIGFPLSDLTEFARSVEGQPITTLEVSAPSRRVEVLAQMAATVGQTADSVQHIDQSATWAVEFAQAILAKIEQAERQE